MKNEHFYTFSEYMKDNKLTISEEDYLEMIYRLCLSENYTRVNELAQSLNIKPPSVSYMLKQLIEKNLIIHNEYGIIQLTDEGKVIGKILLDRHQNIEQFLKLLDVKDNLLEETEKIEHTLCPDTIIKIKSLVLFFNEREDILNQYKHWSNHEQ